MASRLLRLWQGARVFIGNYTQSRARDPRPKLIITPSGAQFELYEPKRSARKSILLMTGIGVLGEADPRLIRLARSFTATGLRVAVPVMEGLKSLRLAQADLSTARDCLDFLLEAYEEPVCIVAFSTGGSIAMRLATEKNFSKRVQLIALFSPVYDPHETWEIFERITRTPIRDFQTSDDEMWLHTVNAYRNHRVLGYTDLEKEAIQEYLGRYTHGLSMEEMISFYQNLIIKHPPDGHSLLMEDTDLNAISPRGKMMNSTTRVIVIHDARDFVVPVDHIHALAHELNQRTPPNHRILITHALSHITVRPQHLLDIFQMIDLIGELYT